ncbi:hypothetical protein [Hymenobacter sp.]|uniref:hypothetical protein n=1 Tax=Hymenobacter sp. TaxID=1898978 RepID=UPI002EDB6CA9
MPIIVFDPQDCNSAASPALDLSEFDPKEVFRIGEFLIGNGEFSNLGGHPEIRY